MAFDSEFPVGAAVASVVFVGLLAFNVGRFADVAGVGYLESAALLFSVPVVAGLAIAAVVRDRLETSRQWLQFVAAVAVLVALLEVAAVGVAANGVDRSVLVGGAAAAALGYAARRWDLPAGVR